MGEQAEHSLHLFVSNQSFETDVANIQISINGRQIFHREMMVGTQHNWEEVTISIASGKHTLIVSEDKTKTIQTVATDIDHELWIAVTFYSPPSRINVNISDHPIRFM